MNRITIYYLSPASDVSSPWLPSERSFPSFKAMSQYIRLNSIKDYSVYVNDQLTILIGNKYWPVSSLVEEIDFAIVLSQINK